MQHHPLGKASRKLHKSARDRANRVIGAMLNWPNQKGKPTCAGLGGHLEARTENELFPARVGESADANDSSLLNLACVVRIPFFVASRGAKLACGP
jgi:hypothetical protein